MLHRFQSCHHRNTECFSMLPLRLSYRLFVQDKPGWILGAVHKVRHAIFGQFLTPFPLSHFVTHPGTPPKSTSHISDYQDFLVGLVQKIRTKAPCTYSLSIVCGVFVWEGLSEGLWFGRFCLGVVFVHSSFCHNTSVTTES